MSDLFLINLETIKNQSLKINAILTYEKEQLFFNIDDGNFEGEAEDTVKNFFKICCAIMNYKPKQREINPIPDVELKEVLKTINEN